MGFLEIVLIVVGVLIGLFFLMILMGGISGNKAGAKAGVLLKNLEDKYDSFVRSHLNLALIDKDQDLPTAEELASETREYLHPDIRGIIAHINATPYSQARTKYAGKLFTNIPPVVNDLFEKSRKSKENVLSIADEKSLTIAYQDAIESDIKRRLLDIKTGKALENL